MTPTDSLLKSLPTTWARPFDFQSATRVIFGEGEFARLGALTGELGFRRTLLVADPGLVAAGYVEYAASNLHTAGCEVVRFHGFDANPDSDMCEAGRVFAAPQNIDSIVALGGGSSLDCAKAINFLLTNGGKMQDYQGYGKAARPMLPMIGVPTTAGTGSEAQSYALISDAQTHVKMACGDPKAAFRAVILDPLLTATQPRAVRAAAGYDAISHAVETYVTTKRSALSECYSRQAWRLLEGSFEKVMTDPGHREARAGMQLGAYFAGAAIENSMLGATHACANPLTARYGTVHGVAIAALLAHVVRWNARDANARYAELSDKLPERLEKMATAAGLATRLSALGVPREDIPLLAENAAAQWTGRFNPRPFDRAGAIEVYECAY
jgi:alcohol dehydrogenase